MAYEPSVNKCFAFLKKPDAHPKAPDFKGVLVITEPGTYDLAMWKGEVGKETKYKGLSVKLTPVSTKIVGTAKTSLPPASVDSTGEALPF